MTERRSPSPPGTESWRENDKSAEESEKISNHTSDDNYESGDDEIDGAAAGQDFGLMREMLDLRLREGEQEKSDLEPVSHFRS